MTLFFKEKITACRIGILPLFSLINLFCDINQYQIERFRICFRQSSFYVLRPKTVRFPNQKHMVSEPKTYGFGAETIKRYHLNIKKKVYQNKIQLSFCHPERSEGSQIHKLMHTRFFAMLRMTLLFDRQFSFRHTLVRFYSFVVCWISHDSTSGFSSMK